RMFAAVGLRVTRLVRVRIGDVTLGRLRVGESRELTKSEIESLGRTIDAAPLRGGVPRVTRRAGFSRARVEGTRPSRASSRTAQAGRPAREREPRAAAGPAARPYGSVRA